MQICMRIYILQVYEFHAQNNIYAIYRVKCICTSFPGKPQPQPQSSPPAWPFLGTVTWKRWDEKMVSWSEVVEIQPIAHRIHVWFTLITQIKIYHTWLAWVGMMGILFVGKPWFFWLVTFFHVWILGDFSAFLFGMMVSTMMFLKVVGDHIYLHLQPKV